MIYITGDTHGELEKFKTKEFKKLKKTDYLIILGDFGFIWDGSKAEKSKLKWLSKRRYKILFLTGTHDNYDKIEEYKMVDFKGVSARKIAENIYRLENGEVYDIEGNKIFACGGGQSDDIGTREEGKTWWPSEMPDLELLKEKREKIGDEVDFIVSHTAPLTIKEFIFLKNTEYDHLELFLNEISKTVDFDRWYFGRYHMDKPIGGKYTAVYNSLLKLEK